MGETFTWIDPTNNQIPLNGESYYTTVVGPAGLYAPPTNIITQDVPLQPGARFKYVDTQIRPVRLPVLVNADTEANLDVARRALLAAMSPLNGGGVLRHMSYDGLTRDLTCYVASGREGDDSGSNRGPGWILLDLRLSGLDPYWYDTSYTSLAFSNGASSSFFAAPFLPIKLASSGILTSFTINNGGDVETWPIWTIVGPASAITMTNNTTGKVLALTNNGGVSLALGHSVVIDTRPGSKSVIVDGATSNFDKVGATSSLWPLAKGANNITIAVSGTTAASQVQVQYKQRYEGV